MILDDIVARRREQLEREMRLISLEEMKGVIETTIEVEGRSTIVRETKIETTIATEPSPRTAIGVETMIETKPEPKRFYNAIDSERIGRLGRLGRLAVISEVKKASPSKGIIREDFNPVDIAVAFEKAGAQAISVLTEEYYFKGCSQYLKQIRQAVSIPILRKDFIIDEYQIYEAKAIGADAILLIVAILDKETLEKFLTLATSLELDCLVEVHDEKELELAISCGADIIGINNRNLKTFEVNLETTKKLALLVPDGCIVVSESGIASNDDMKALKACGVNAVLIGETLIRSGDVKKTLNSLRAGV